MEPIARFGYIVKATFSEEFFIALHCYFHNYVCIFKTFIDTGYER